jgi:hypothetical protein
MRSKEKEKTVELKCACALCGRSQSQCECERAVGADAVDPASSSCAGSETATGAETVSCESAAAETGSANTESSESASAETGGAMTASSTSASSNKVSLSAALPDQRPEFPAPTGVARLKWLFSAILLCIIIAVAGVWLFKWRHEPVYKLTLQTSYTEMQEHHHVREAINLANLALRQAEHQHASDKELAPINAQLRYLYLQRYLDRQRNIPVTPPYPYHSWNYHRHYRAHGAGSAASHFANIAPQTPASAAK